MTDKLFYSNPFLQTFSASVLSCEKIQDRWGVILDRTAFYPEGGGQPADFGTIAEASVFDVREHSGNILHFCDLPLAVGSSVQGTIQFQRRFDFMQQHSGEHIVSGLICSRFHCDNVGFHIGHPFVTIDFNAELTMDEVREIECLANQYIWEDHPVEISWPGPDELQNLSYRSKKALNGPVRIVSWPGADCCACCGTHVQSSGQIGLVKLLSCQKFRSGVRIEMAAGGRAVAWFDTVMRQNTLVSQMLSAKPSGTAEAVERLQKEAAELKGRVADLEESDFAGKAEHYAGAGDVLLFDGPMTANALRKLCSIVQGRAGGRCAVFAGADGVFQYAVSLPGGELRPLAKQINAALHGRGGGKAEFIQGSVQAGQDVIQEFWEHLP